MNFVHLFFLISSVQGFDFVVEAFRKYVDPSVAPCENFYRHSCKRGDTKYVMFSTYLKLAQQISSRNHHVWDDFQVLRDLKNSRSKKYVLYEQIPDLYYEICTNGEDANVFFDHFDYALGAQSVKCAGHSCYKYILDDPDCLRGRKELKEVLRFKVDQELTLEPELELFEKRYKIIWTMTRDINVHLDEDVREGIALTKEFLDSMKEIAAKWIEKTPWVINQNLLNSTSTLLWPSALQDDYALILRDSLDILTTIELAYRSCKDSFSNPELAVLLCTLNVMNANALEEKANWFSIIDAFNEYPTMSLGYAFYHVAQYSENMAAKLGFTGAVVGHELAHTFIKSYPGDFLTYFSDNAKNCIQEQFNATCEAFMEDSCVTVDQQFDDNGADVLGLQLAYKLLEEYYGCNLNETYEPLNVTHQQLFFYSLALGFCDATPSEARNETGPFQHSSDNVRVNAMLSQHPGFKEAFQCTEENKMIQSAREECIVYGEGAPETKRH